MNEEFEFTLHAPNSPVFGRFFAGLRPACAHVLVQPCVGGCRHPGLVRSGLNWAVVVRGRRRSEGEEQEHGRREEEERKKKRGERLSGGGGMSWVGRGQIRGAAQNYQFALPYSLSFIRPKVVHI